MTIKPPSLFDFLKAVNESGGDRNILDSEEAYKAYSPFMVGRGVAQSLNTVMLAQELNKCVVTDKDMHFDFLFHSIKKQKRYAKWARKEDKPEDLELIKQVYQVNEDRALSYLELLDDEQLKQIRESYDKGGQIGRGTKKTSI